MNDIEVFIVNDLGGKIAAYLQSKEGGEKYFYASPYAAWLVKLTKEAMAANENKDWRRRKRELRKAREKALHIAMNCVSVDEKGERS